MAEIPDWPNQQLVRGDHSGPGMNTPPGLDSDAVITYGPDGLNYEFMLRTVAGEVITGTRAVEWDFGDGHTAKGVKVGVPATNTYAAPGNYTVSSSYADRTRLLALHVAGD